MRRVLSNVLLVAVLVYGAACAALFFFQRSLLYFPQPAHVATPLVPVEGRDGVVASHRALPGAQAVVYFGGNGEDVTQNLAPLAQAFPQHALYLLHYRGYGRSTGKPTEADIAADALALFDQVRQQHPQVTVIGRSLGSGVATRLASQRPAARLVLITPYDSIEDIAAAQFRLFPVRWLLIDKYASWRYAPQVQAPTTVLMAEHDEVIPRSSTEQLMTRFAAGRATLHLVPGTGHNDISFAPGYDRLLAAQP
ncbi:alpha/beta hydrolase [Piscinibacter sp. HJYY11]|uniref:alpha/beta hydrolase n=1 Tax=Piscinibacter sp. HJYY11 TaxID=2801333 RepID=UPI00191F2F5A|nr:alpha/beta fold hydrolase [Piscinibacter sp. HJYY11]MBL0728727.1 alpha/beta fold hydrolase [Piscinibacter sp. HJYY11]